jgi:protein-tyrosine phosphatase
MQNWEDGDFMQYNVICIFNTYEKVINAPSNALKLFFNDVDNEQLSLIERSVYKKSSFLYSLYVKYRQRTNHFYGLPFLEKDAQLIKSYVNLNKSILVHCEYGHSRSVAVARYFQQYHNYEYIKEPQEYEGNNRVFDILKNAYEDDD